MKNTKNATRRLVLAAMMGALSFVLMYFSISIPILSPFAEIDLSALPELIGGFLLGPLGAIEIVSLKILLKLAFKGTESMFTGELQALLLSLAYVLPAVFYYRKHRTKKGAAIGLVMGVTVAVVISVFTNMFIIFPFYMYLYGMDWNSIIKIFSAINPWINNVPTMIILSIIPFNILTRSITAVLAMLLYKRISNPIKNLVQ